MKKRVITSLLIGTITITSIAGCGASHMTDSAGTSESGPAFVEAEYPAECPESYAPETEPVAEYPESYAPETEPVAEYPESYAPETEPQAETSYAADSSSTYISPEYPVNASNGSAAAKSYAACEEAPEWMDYADIDYYKPYVNSGENYNRVVENGFMDATSSPLSTFGADIDTASYSNLRRMITDGYRLRDIPAGSIRTEELVNYFNYDYREPGRDDMFAVNASIIDCPWNRETRLVNLGIKAKKLEDTEDVASNIVFLVDVSGSMSDYDKLPLLQMGLEMLVDNLNENDRVSIVTYASTSDVVIAGVPGNKHSQIKKAINGLSASGSTNGGDGIRSAYKLAEKYFIEGGNNRVIMATDGDLNVGITSEEELEKLISDKKEGGVFLSVMGFGTGNYNEVTLETLADKGNGNYSYIDSLSEAKKVLIDEFDSTLFTVAKDVKFQVEFNPKYVSEYRPVGYENRQMAATDFNNDAKDGGEIGSGHAMTVMYEIRMNDDHEDNADTLRYRNAGLSETGLNSNEWMTVSVRYKEPEADESQLIYFPITDECYTEQPNCDTLFSAYVAECGMILNGSEYIGSLSISDVSRQLSKLDLEDSYKEEVLELIEQL